MKTVHQFRLLICLIFLFSYQFVGAQAIKEKIEQNISEIQNTKSYTPLKEATTDELEARIPEAVLSQKQTFQVQPKQIQSIKRNHSKYLRLAIPVAGQDLELQLMKADIFKGDFKVVAASDPDMALDVDTGIHYRGLVKDQTNSLVAISFFEDEIVGAIHVNGEDYTIGKVKETDYHILYKNNDLNHDLSFECGAIPVNNTDAIPATPTEKSGVMDCVRIHVEADYSLYSSKGFSITNTTNYCTGLFAQVAVMFANESIETGMSYLKIWDIPSPYSDSTQLSDLTNQGYGRTHGDVVHLLHRYGGGGVAYLNVLCNSSNNTGVSGVSGSYNNVPTYSWDVFVVTHELGHNLGSPHTHDCYWNGNFTQIDDCGNKYYDEDSYNDTNPEPCYDSNNQILPSAGGGTIMSYCHLYNSSIGVGLGNGFGTQPGNLIRSRVNSASCLIPCVTGPTCTDGQQNGNETGVDCGGPDCPACPSCTDGVLNGNETQIDCGGPDCAACVCTNNIRLYVIINTDTFGDQITWRISNGSGSISYAVGGPYAQQIQTITELPCLPVGCYNFTIYDSSGDGLYDGNNTGSYTVVDEFGNILASGSGDFGGQESTNICLQGGCADVKLKFSFDDHPEETSWYMIDASGAGVGSGGPYNLQTPNTSRTENLCLLDGCYYLLVSDSGNNGMCPQESSSGFTIVYPPGGGKNTPDNNSGNSFGTGAGAGVTGISAVDQSVVAAICGRYEVKDANNALLTSGGGDFGSTQTVSFCLNNGVGAIQYTPENEAYQRAATNDLTTATMRVFPTLVQDQLTIAYTITERKSAQLTVFDINGTAVQQQDLNTDVANTQVDVRDLSAGMYFVQLISEGVMLTEKFIKQ